MLIDPKKRYLSNKKFRQQSFSTEGFTPLPHMDVSDEALTKMLTVTPDDIVAFEEALTQDFAEQNIDMLFAECRQRVLQSIIGPLGLGKFMAMYDRVGGNVDTIHNSRKFVDDDGNIYDKKPKNVSVKAVGTEEFQEKYEKREENGSPDYHRDKAYIDNNREMSAKKAQGELKDAYTGNTFGKNDKHDQDHDVSVEENRNDGAVILSGLDPVALANDKSNLFATNPTINRAKGAKTMQEFIEYLERTREVRQAEIKTLKDKESLTEKEQKRLKKLETLESANTELMAEIDRKSREKRESKINQTYYQSYKFIKNSVHTSAKEGAKMGMQQAIGLLLYDVTNSLVDELVDSYKHGFVNADSGESFMAALKVRLERVSQNILKSWQKYIIAFRDGALSGFFSNIITILINTFFTTAKNVVRIIREGTFVLYQAGKIIFFPPKNLDSSEVWDAALKLIVAGAFTLGGIALEEIFEKTIVANAFFAPYAHILSPIFIGILTGVSTACTLYAIDKWDPFGMHDKKKRQHVRKKLDEIALGDLQNIERICQEFGLTPYFSEKERYLLNSAK